MIDPSNVIVAVIGVVGAVGASLVVTRAAKKQAASQSNRDNAGAMITGSGEFREQILQRVSDLEQKLESQRLYYENLIALRDTRYETAILEAAKKFEAREDQLTEWGMWEATNPPRRPPAFIWPPVGSPHA